LIFVWLVLSRIWKSVCFVKPADPIASRVIKAHNTLGNVILKESWQDGTFTLKNDLPLVATVLTNMVINALEATEATLPLR